VLFRSRLLAAHRNILDALKSGDAATAEEWMKRHIEDFRRGYELANLDIDTPITRFPLAGENDSE
jgi:DNA-binding GntR family transcriptional regulator